MKRQWGETGTTTTLSQISLLLLAGMLPLVGMKLRRVWYWA